MQKEKKDKHFIKKPEYIGGEPARKKYVAESLRYPEEALKNNIQGAVHLQYAVGYQGEIKNVKVISGIGYGCDEEAIRIVKGFQYKVSRKHHLSVEFNKNIHIHFKINRPEAAVKTEAIPPMTENTPVETNTFQIVYHTPEHKKDQDKPSGGYEYAISLT
jgi:TonB family protein